MFTLIVQGFSIGLVFNPMTVMAYTTLSPQLRGEGTALVPGTRGAAVAPGGGGAGPTAPRNGASPRGRKKWVRHGLSNRIVYGGLHYGARWLPMPVLKAAAFGARGGAAREMLAADGKEEPYSRHAERPNS